MLYENICDAATLKIMQSKLCINELVRIVLKSVFDSKKKKAKSLFCDLRSWETHWLKKQQPPVSLVNLKNFCEGSIRDKQIHKFKKFTTAFESLRGL